MSDGSPPKNVVLQHSIKDKLSHKPADTEVLGLRTNVVYIFFKYDQNMAILKECTTMLLPGQTVTDIHFSFRIANVFLV